MNNVRLPVGRYLVEPPEAVLHLARDPPPRAAPLVRVLAHRQAELGGDDEIIPAALDGPADDLLGLTPGVDVSRVDDVDASLERAVDDADRILQIRLQEARALLMTQPANVAEIGYLVGYESPSQFSREYRRLFGAPPHRDVAALKAEAQSPEFAEYHTDAVHSDA